MLTEPDISAEELGRIRARTLVLAGSRDLVKESDTKFIATRIPGAKFRILMRSSGSLKARDMEVMSSTARR